MVRQLIHILTGKPYASSIGIIGGADGPTAIFVTKPSPDPTNWILPLILAAVGIGVILFLHRRDKK